MDADTERILTNNLNQLELHWLIKSLKELSYDSSLSIDTEHTNSPYYDYSHPTLSECRAIDFDNIAKLYSAQIVGHVHRLRSCDAFYITPHDIVRKANTIYLIEFKNGNITNNDVDEIYEKVRNSRDILNDIVESGILDDGELDLSDVLSPALKPCKDERKFGLSKRLSRLGIDRLSTTYFRNNLVFILVYNESKKERLIDGDIAAIQDEIEKEDEGKYAGFTAYISVIYGNADAANIMCIFFDIGDVSNEQPREIFKKLTKKVAQGNRGKRQFGNLCRIIKLGYEIYTRESYQEAASIWNTLMINNIHTDVIDDFKSVLNPEMKQRYTVFENNSSTSNILNILFFALLCGIKEKDLKKTLSDFITIMKKHYHQYRYDNGDYDPLLQTMERDSYPVDIAFEGKEDRYRKMIEHRIQTGEMDELISSVNGENIYTPLLLLTTVNQATIWPDSFFRFGKEDGFLYKKSYTYTRDQFYDFFIEGVCKNSCKDAYYWGDS